MNITPDDVGIELGRQITAVDEGQQIERWIARVESRIRKRIPSVDALRGDPDYAETYKGVVVDVVARRVRNPEGKQNERVDDYSYGLFAEAAKPDLWPTDAEWAELTPTQVFDGPFTGSIAYQRGGR